MIEQAIESMKVLYNGEDSQVEHTLKVLHFAEQILKKEHVSDSFTQIVVKLASIYHDIGIPEARRKHGSSAPKFQELEGPEIARRLMAEINIRRDIQERVCYIVGHHHTQSKIDSLDFQIVWEADLITNVLEGWNGIDRISLKNNLKTNFITSAGIEIVSEIL